MKRFFLFIISFIVLLIVFQLLSGWLLTAMYVPDMEDAWRQAGHLPRYTELVRSFNPTFLMAVLAAAVSYFIPKIFMKR